MTSNITELLSNVASKAPWLMGSCKTFSPEIVLEDAHQVLATINDYNLTIITDRGRVFNQHLVLKLKDNRVMIDKPSAWDDSVVSFHVFFRNRDNICTYFLISRAEYDQMTITARIPDTIYFLQKRRFRRSLPPVGTKVIFRNDRNLIDTAFVHDISEGGMLIWSGGSQPLYRVNPTIYDFFISLPPEDRSGRKDHINRVLPYITRGKIVRINTDQSSLICYYGISFIHESILFQRRLTSLIAEMTHPYPAKITFANGLHCAIDRQQKTSALPRLARTANRL